MYLEQYNALCVYRNINKIWNMYLVLHALVHNWASNFLIFLTVLKIISTK